MISPTLLDFPSPERESGYLAATKKVTPCIIDLPESTITHARKQASLAGVSLGEWVGDRIMNQEVPK